MPTASAAAVEHAEHEEGNEHEGHIAAAAKQRVTCRGQLVCNGSQAPYVIGTMFARVRKHEKSLVLRLSSVHTCSYSRCALVPGIATAQKRAAAAPDANK
jgi:hypothetical protein